MRSAWRQWIVLVFLAAGTVGTGPPAPTGAGKSTPPPVPELAATRDVDPAVAELTGRRVAAVHAKPDSADARFELAKVYHANALDDLAAATYEQVVELDPDNARAWHYLAIVRDRLGDTAGAIEAVEQAARLDPSYAPAQWRRGVWLLDQGRLDEAARSFHRSTQLNPEDPEGWLGLVLITMRRGDYERAVKQIEQLRRHRPKLRYAIYLQGRALAALGERERAGPLLEQGAGARAPRLDRWEHELRDLEVGFRAEFERAQAHIRSGRPAQAIPLLESLAARYPDDVAVLTAYAAALKGAGRLDEAQAILDAALERAPDHYLVRRARAGVALDRAELDTALAEIERSIELNPAQGASHELHATILFEQGRTEDALRAFEAAIASGHATARVLRNKGRVEFALERREEAVRTLERAVERYPHLLWLWEDLTRMYAALGRLEDAERALGQATALVTADTDRTRLRTLGDQMRQEIRDDVEGDDR